MMKRDSLSHLSPNERLAVDALVEALKREADGQILLVAMFGSKARGDAGEDSDIDILIVTDTDPQQIENRIRKFSSGLALEHSLTFNKFILSRERWADYARRHAAFWQNIQRDGALLLHNPSLPNELDLLPDFDGDNLMADHRPEIRHYMELAREALNDTQFSFEQARYRITANRAYYAVFYAANAMLATLGLQRAKHSGVKATFQERFIKTGLIEDTYSDDYEEAMEKRETSDYDAAFSISEPFARDCLERARRFVERMERYLKEKGHL
jgi:uncharacterized protein (UPF0332 family)/predicted nucleotidyltransferase